MDSLFKMKFMIAALLSVYFISNVYCQEKYTDKYDGMDIDEILNNKRLTNAYFKCIEGSGKCTAEGRYLKTHITDALKTGCKKCTGTQQRGIRKVIRHIIKEDQNMWKKLVQMYDPKGEYAKKYQEEYKELQG